MTWRKSAGLIQDHEKQPNSLHTMTIAGAVRHPTAVAPSGKWQAGREKGAALRRVGEWQVRPAAASLQHSHHPRPSPRATAVALVLDERALDAFFILLSQHLQADPFVQAYRRCVGRWSAFSRNTLARRSNASHESLRLAGYDIVKFLACMRKLGRLG
jgi:hypothetical protein